MSSSSADFVVVDDPVRDGPTYADVLRVLESQIALGLRAPTNLLDHVAPACYTSDERAAYEGVP